MFDYNLGNPYPVNMDGLHLNGNCHFGTIRDLHGATYDNLVALNAEEGSCGPISHIVIDGLFAQRCQSFVRLLTASQAVSHIHIRNVHGSSFLYGIGVTNYYYNRTTEDALFDALVFENLHLAKGELVAHPDYPRGGADRFGLINFDRKTHTKSIHISGLYRTEQVSPTPTVEIEAGAVIENLLLEDCHCTGTLPAQFPFVLNGGEVENATLQRISTESGKLWTGNEPRKSNLT